MKAWLAALAGFAITLVFFFPGYATSDTFAQFHQATTGTFDDVHPPLMALAWRPLLAVSHGTAPWLVLVAVLFWSGLARVATALRIDGARGAIVVLAVGLWPAVLLLLGMVWKDIALAAILLHVAASAFRRQHLVIVLSLMAIACALRHNAWPAVLPFLWLALDGRIARFALASLALLVAPALLAKVVDAGNKHVWTTLPVFDLGAMSASTGEVLLPENVAPTLTPAEARQFHRPWSNVALVDSGKVRISFFYPYTDAMRAELRLRWMESIASHPGAYLAHRWSVFHPLVWRIDATDAPRELVYSHAQRIAPADSVVREPPRLFTRLIESTWRSPFFGVLIYVALAVATMLRRTRANARAATALIASSLLYALPLFLIAVASEYRYIYWSVVAALLAFVVSLCSRSENRGG